MKRNQTKLIVIFLLSLMLIASTQVFAQTQTPSLTKVTQVANQSEFFDKTFWQNVAVAILTGLISFGSGYYIAVLSKKPGSFKKLSYSLSIEKGLVKVEENIRKRVKVLYDSEEIENLYQVRCDIENTGMTAIKDQYIRFEFTKDTRLLDFTFDPIPQPELKVEMVNEPGLSSYERKCKIGQIEKNQTVGFLFTATSITDIQLKLYPSNESGDVDFSPQSVTKATNDKVVITNFLILTWGYYIVPSIMNIPGFFLSDFISYIIRLIFLSKLYPTIIPFSEIIADKISRWLSEKESTSKIINIDIGDVDSNSNITINQQ